VISCSDADESIEQEEARKGEREEEKITEL
jgi:hypothetical protein